MATSVPFHTSRAEHLPAAQTTRATPGVALKLGTSVMGQAMACGCASVLTRKMATLVLAMGLAQSWMPWIGATPRQRPVAVTSSPLPVRLKAAGDGGAGGVGAGGCGGGFGPGGGGGGGGGPGGAG